MRTSIYEFWGHTIQPKMFPSRTKGSVSPVNGEQRSPGFHTKRQNPSHHLLLQETTLMVVARDRGHLLARASAGSAGGGSAMGVPGLPGAAPSVWGWAGAGVRTAQDGLPRRVTAPSLRGFSPAGGRARLPQYVGQEAPAEGARPQLLQRPHAISVSPSQWPGQIREGSSSSRWGEAGQLWKGSVCQGASPWVRGLC